MVGRLSELDSPAEIDDSLALGDKELSCLELTDDLLGRVADSLHRGVPGAI